MTLLITYKTFRGRPLSVLFPLLLLAAVFSGCRPAEPLTRRLFMESSRATIELPYASSEGKNATGGGLLSESVTYRHADNRSVVQDKADSLFRGPQSLDQMQYLNAVTVTGALTRTFAPEREGKVDVDFVMRVPKELFSSHWQLELRPVLLAGDSVISLRKVLLTGRQFASRQHSDSLAFAAWESSIVGQSSYDSLFLDHQGVSSDVHRLQQFYYRQYNLQYQQAVGYLHWKERTQERIAAHNQRVDTRRLELYHKYMRQSLEHSTAVLAYGGDTTGLSDKYRGKFERRVLKNPRYNSYKALGPEHVPGKYTDFFLNDLKPEDITNHSITAKDLARISSHRYDFALIAENQLKDSRREEVQDKMMPFTRQEGLYLDSIADGDSDFVLLYRHEYPVGAGLKSLRIFLDGQVTATDRSGYRLPAGDTLDYVISSLVQLADTSLVVKQTKLHRNMYDKMTLRPHFQAGQSLFNPAAGTNGPQADSLIKAYRRLTGELGLDLDSLVIVTHTAPQGSFDKNHELSVKRGQSIKQYLLDHYPGGPDSLRIKTRGKGEDWQGFVNALRQRGDIADRDSIFALVERTAFPDKTQQEIKRRYPQDYRIIRDSVYPALERTDVTFHVSRPGMAASDSIAYQTREGYREGLHLLAEREYWKALEILKDYPDYNTALCLACMGYNGKAYDLLSSLPQTANNNYLLAILAVRMDKEPQAVEYLLKAVEQDPAKAYRIALDTEVRDLAQKYGLAGRLRQLTDSRDYQEAPARQSAEENNIQSE